MALAVVDAVVAGGGDGEAAGLGDGQLAGLVLDGVVALGGLAGRGDGVGAALDGLARGAGDGVLDGVPADGAGHGGGEGRVGLAVDLGLVVGGDGDGLRGDLEGAARGGRLVVRVGGAHGDGLLADVLDRRGGGGPLAVAHLVLDGGALGHAGLGAGGVALAVVDAVVAGGGDGHGRRCNGELHRRTHGPVDGVVRVIVGAALLDERGGVVADVCALGGLAAAVGELARVEAGVGAGRGNGALVGLLAAVVDLLGAGAVDGDVEGRRLDRQLDRSVGYRVLGDGVLAVGAGKRTGYNLRIRTDIGSRCCGRCRVQRERHAIRQRLNLFAGNVVLHGVLAVGLLGAVVSLGCLSSRDYDRNILCPDGIEIVVRDLLVCCDVGSFIVARCIGEERSVLIPEEVHISGSWIALFCPTPADKGVSLIGEGIRGFDHNRRVVRHVVAGNGSSALKRVHVSARGSAVVGVPRDVCRSRMLRGLVLGTKLDGVNRGFDGGSIFLIHNIMHPRVGLQHGVGVARKNGLFGIHELGAVPLLDHPVREDMVGARSSTGSLRDRLGVVLVQESVARRIASAVRVVHDADALSALDLAAPLGIEIETPGDPRTICVLVGGLGRVAVQIKLGRAGLVVLVGVRVVQNVRIEVERLRASLVGVPADELVFAADAVDLVDSLASANAEGCVLAAHGERRVVRGYVGVQEDTILGLNPLGVDRHALGHGGPGVLGCAGVVNIPTGEHETVKRRDVVVCTGLAIVCNRSAVVDVLDLVELSTVKLFVTFNRVSITVDVDAVHE